MVTDTPRGAQLRTLIPAGSALAVPAHFYVEVAGALRRLELRGALARQRAVEAFEQLLGWPLRRVSVAALLPDAWTCRHNHTVSDALYLVLADRLKAALLTDDRRLAGAPTFPASVTRLTPP